MTQLIHLKRLNQARQLAKLGIKSLDREIERDKARLITNNKQLITKNKFISPEPDEDKVQGLSPQEASPPPVGDQTPSGPEGLSHVGSTAREQITGLHIQIAKPKRSYRCYITYQTNHMRQQVVKLTSFLTNRRRDFVRERQSDVCDQVVELYDQLKSQGNQVYLGHCHLRSEWKTIIPGFGLVFDLTDQTVYFIQEEQVFNVALDQDMTNRQTDIGYLLQGSLGQISRVNSLKSGGLAALKDHRVDF
jgi:hypothetical protein